MITIFCIVVLSVIRGISLNTGVLPFSKGRALHVILILDWLEEIGVLIDFSEKTMSVRGSNEDGLFIKEIHTPRLR
jgi:hypothetical protein